MSSKIKLEEQIFLYVKYKDQSNYVKISQGEYNLVLVKESISAAFEDFYVDNCNFFWDEVLIPDSDLVPLIKAKQSCGHFRIALKEKTITKKEVPEIVMVETTPVKETDVFLVDEDSVSQSVVDDYEFGEIPHFLRGEEEPALITDDNLMAQSERLREYFNSNVDTRILLLDDPTKPCVRKNIISCAVKYLFQECGLYPDVTQKSHLVKILVEVFKKFKPDEDLVMRWVHDKISNMRKKMRREEDSLTKLMETSLKRKREESDQEESDQESSFSGIVVLNSNKFKDYINSDIHTRLLVLDKHTEPSVRKSIINCSVKFLFNECGLYPSLSQKRALIELIADAFPGLKHEKENIKRWVSEKIKNFRKRTKQVETTFIKNLDRERTLTAKTGIQEGIGFLESCTEIEDITQIQRALQDTLTYRLGQYSNPEFSVYQTYTFFRKSLDLILYEFGVRFPSVQENLMDNFELFLDAASNIYTLDTKQNLPEEDYAMDIRKFLSIFHYTRTPTGAKKPYQLSDMIDEVITFSTVSNCV
ncbi:hypothetical protein ACFFRR_002969 [Megaselia abdita]